MVGDEEKGVQAYRPSPKALPTLDRHLRPNFLPKALASFNNYSKWKHKLRENCFRRVREDRTRLLWKFRLPDVKDQSANRQDTIKSALHDIVSDELRKIKGSSVDGSSAPMVESVSEDMIWEYDGLHTAHQGDCEEILLEMQRIFYEDHKTEVTEKAPCRADNYIQTWEDQEDDYLACAVFEHMRLNNDKVAEEVWCPVCVKGELHENGHDIYCSRCELKLKRGQEADLNLLRSRLAEAHTEHLDRGCRLRPEFCLETKFELTALYMKCQSCNTFEIVL